MKVKSLPDSIRYGRSPVELGDLSADPLWPARARPFAMSSIRVVALEIIEHADVPDYESVQEALALFRHQAARLARPARPASSLDPTSPPPAPRPDRK